MFTAKVEYIPIALFMELNHAQLAALPESTECLVLRLILGGTLTMAQINIASQVGGTIMAFTMKRCLIFCGDISRNGSWIIQ